MTKDPDKKPNLKEYFNRNLGLKDVLFILLLIFTYPAAKFIYQKYEAYQHQQMVTIFEKNKIVPDWKKLTNKEKNAYCYIYFTHVRADRSDNPPMLSKSIIQATESKVGREKYSKQCTQYIDAKISTDMNENIELSFITKIMLIDNKWSYIDDLKKRIRARGEKRGY